MKNKQPIEEQVAQLTEEQKKSVVKVGKTGTILMALGYIPVFAAPLLIFGPILLGLDGSVAMLNGFLGIVIALVGAIYFVGVMCFIKIKHPYYSDAKYKYLVALEKKTKEQA